MTLKLSKGVIKRVRDQVRNYEKSSKESRGPVQVGSVNDEV